MMRLIDADALKDGYMHMGYNPNEHPEESYMEGWCKGFNAAVDHCLHHVIHAPTIEPMRWIPCSERMPEGWQWFYATCRSKVDDRENWVIEGLSNPWELWGDLPPMVRAGDAEIIAWMPLPEPYKGD